MQRRPALAGRSPQTLLFLILASTIACTPPTTLDDRNDTGSVDTEDSAETGDTDTGTQPLGGSCEPDSAPWSGGEWRQAYVDVDTYGETCSAGTGHFSDNTMSFDLAGDMPQGSIGRHLTITATDPPGHVGSSGLTLEELSMGMTLRVFFTDDEVDYTADVTFESQGLADVAVTWVEQP